MELNSALKINQPTQIQTSMKESNLLESEIYGEGYNAKNEIEKIINDATKSRFAVSNYKLDYLGNDFVYDDYNQNPDSVKENRFGYKVLFTRDADLLEDYYTIRMNAYQNRLGFEKFNKLETDYDKEGRIIIVTKSGKVIGGMRLMFTGECKYFSAEYPGTQFQYEKVTQRYHDERHDLKNVEASGVAAVESGRDFTVLESMFELMFQNAQSRECNYIFGIALISACRLYRLVFERLGFYLDIILSYPWEKKEAFNFLPTFPIYVKLK